MTQATREQLLAELVARLDTACVLHAQGRVADAEASLRSARVTAQALGLPERGIGDAP